MVSTIFEHMKVSMEHVQNNVYFSSLGLDCQFTYQSQGFFPVHSIYKNSNSFLGILKRNNDTCLKHKWNWVT